MLEYLIHLEESKQAGAVFSVLCVHIHVHVNAVMKCTLFFSFHGLVHSALVTSAPEASHCRTQLRLASYGWFRGNPNLETPL